MSNSEEGSISDDLKESLKMMVKFREAYVELKSENMKLEDTNFTLKNMLKVAQDNEKQHNLYRSDLESVIIKQNNIITGFVDKNEENLKLKKQLECLNETLQSSNKEIENLHLKTADELKAMQDSHENEILHLHEHYHKEEQHKEERFLENKKQLEMIISELKQNIDSLQTEKNIVIEVTVREYEDRLKSLRTSLEESQAEQKSLEERNISNMNLYTKRLESQEQNYISMLETIRKEVVTAKSINKSKQNQQRKPENSSSFQDTTPQPINSNSKVWVQKSDLRDEQYVKNDLPVNISYYNHLQIPVPHSVHGQKPHSYYTGATTSAYCTNEDANSENIARGVYNYLKNNASKPNSIISVSNSSNTFSEERYNKTENKIKVLTDYSATSTTTINKVVVPKKRKLFSPQEHDDLIEIKY